MPNMNQLYDKFKLKDRPLAVMWKGKHELVTIPKEYFYRLI